MRENPIVFTLQEENKEDQSFPLRAVSDRPWHDRKKGGALGSVVHALRKHFSSMVCPVPDAFTNKVYIKVGKLVKEAVEFGPVNPQTGQVDFSVSSKFEPTIGISLEKLQLALAGARNNPYCP